LQTAPGVKGAEGMALARAECTFGAGEYESAARLFEASRDVSTDPRYQVEAAREAVRSWEAETARQQEAGLLEGRDLPLPSVLRSLVISADALVARFPHDANSPAAAFQAGEIFYRYHDWAEARRRLEEVAARWPGTEVAKRASRLVVESHLASRDWSAGEAAASRFRQQASPRDAPFALELQGLELASRFQRATELLNEKKWSDAAAIFQAIADEAPRHPLADKALYNAAICQENDRHFQAASSLFGRIVAEHPGSSHAAESLFRQASLAENAFDFAKAAERYQSLIARYPDSRQARDALYNRALSLEILQRYEEAGLALERHASLTPAAGDAPATLLHAAEVFGKGAAWPRVVRTLQEFQRRYSRAGDPELLVVAHLRAGRAESELGQDEAARDAYAKAVAEFGRRGLDPLARPAGAAAAAEAQFRLAERELQRFDRGMLPSTSQAGALEKALKARLSEMSKLASRYDEVKRYQSPDWTVAALYRQGYLSERFARALQEAPVPPEFKKAGQERYLAEYQAQLASFAQPYDVQAVEAYMRATRLAQELRVESEWTRRAAAALARLRPGEFAHLSRTKGRFLPESPPRLDEEEQAARKAIEADDRNVTALVKLAVVSLARKRLELASAVLASAHKVAPDDPKVWNALGLVDLALGARVQAQARWKKATELDPGCADAQANLGQLLVEAGDFQGAVAALERAVRIAPGSAPAWLGLGSAYQGLGRVDDAQRAGERALALDAGKTPDTGGVQ
jgi:tetratricopeptide (TPR) repeat protein